MSKGSSSSGIYKKQRALKQKQFNLKSKLATRKINTREEKPSILIVCEGKKTEPNYFKDFRLSSLKVKCQIDGAGRNTLSLVEYAIELRQKAIKQNNKIDIIWCVFDKDSFTKAQVNNAFQLAKKEDIKIAYSNEAFEIWYLFHFGYYRSSMHRSVHIEKLNKQYKKNNFGRKYKKNDENTYDYLIDIQHTAIKNAKKRLPNGVSSANQKNPSTSVHLLVEELNKYI